MGQTERSGASDSKGTNSADLGRRERCTFYLYTSALCKMLIYEKHVKPTTSAIQSSNLNLTPQPDPTGNNPLLLVINIPPPTAESRRATVNEATKAGEKASTSIKDGRGKQQKKLRSMQVNKSARPDDLKKAGDRMEKIVEKGQVEVKKIVDNAKKVLDGG